VKIDYFDLIKRAWQITWKHRFLWLFGFILALAAGGSNVSNSLNYSFNGADTSTTSGNLGAFANSYLVFILFFAAVIGLLGFIVWVLSIFATGGLVGAAAKIERGEPTSLADGFKIGAKNFWRILGLNIVIGLIILALVMVLIVPLVVVIIVMASAGGQGSALPAGLICLIPVFILGLLLLALAATILSLISIYATRYIVLEKGGVFNSFSRGWRLIKRKFASTFVVFLLVWLISALAATVFAIPGLIIGIPVFLTLFAGIAGKNVLIVSLAAFGFVLLAVVMSFFNGVLEAYRSVIWTLTFLHLAEEPKGQGAATPAESSRLVPMIVEQPKPRKTAAKPAPAKKKITKPKKTT